METEPLFDIDPDWIQRHGAAARRTIRQSGLISIGLHPLALKLDHPLALHPLAGSASCPCEKGYVSRQICPHHRIMRAEPATTCGSCRWLGKLDQDNEDGTNPSPLKCWVAGGSRVSRGEATTVRRWWPACVDYEGSADDG
jgi:hypothetical protein